MIVRYESDLRDRVGGEPQWTFAASPAAAAVEAALPHADVYVGLRLSADQARVARSLRLVQVPGAGTEGIDLEALDEKVVVANTYNHERSISEHVFMVMVALSRNLLSVDADFRRGSWRNPIYDPGLSLPGTLRGKTIGLIGYGHIGRDIASVAMAFDMRVIAITRHRKEGPGQGVDFLGVIADLPTLLGESDFVVVGIPLTDQTRGLIGARELRSMKKSAFLINVARGPIVDEGALREALRLGWIAGAGIDVWYRYPAAGAAITEADIDFGPDANVVVTPHYSGVTHETYQRRTDDIVANLERLRRGQELLNVVRRAGTP